MSNEAKKRFTFKLRSGSHSCKDDSGKFITIEPKGILHTDVDMALLEGADRWERLEDAGQETLEDLKARIRILEALVPKPEPAVKEPVVEATKSDDLNDKSVKELRALAAGMEPPADLTDCNGKAEMINAIRIAVDAA